MTEAVLAVLDQLHSAMDQEPSGTTGRDLDAAMQAMGEVQACADATTLDRWIDNVLGAKTAADVLS